MSVWPLTRGILAVLGIPIKRSSYRISGLCSGMKSAVRYDCIISDYFPVDSGVSGMFFCPNTLEHWHGPCNGKKGKKSVRGVSFETVRITTVLDFADDALIFAETTEVLAEALDSPSEIANPSRSA